MRSFAFGNLCMVLCASLLLASASAGFAAEPLEKTRTAQSKVVGVAAPQAPEGSVTEPGSASQAPEADAAATTDADDAFAKARAFQMEGKSKEALETYTLAIIHDPNSEEAYSNRALVYEDLDQFEFAKQDLTKAIELNPNFDFAWASRAEVNFSLGKYDDCIADANEAIRINPDNAFAYAQLACAYGNQGKKDEALKAAQQAATRESRDNFLRVLGTALKEQGKLDEAIEQFTKSIAVTPHADAFEQRANCYCRQAKYDLALADYDEALKLKPNDGHFLGERALVLWLAGKDSEAQEAARTAVTSLLRCAHSYSALVLEDVAKELPAVARVNYLNRSLKASDGTDDGRLYFLLADVHAKMKDKKQSAADIEKGVSLGFKHGTAH